MQWREENSKIRGAVKDQLGAMRDKGVITPDEYERTLNSDQFNDTDFVQKLAEQKAALTGDQLIMTLTGTRGVSDEQMASLRSAAASGDQRAQQLLKGIETGAASQIEGDGGYQSADSGRTPDRSAYYFDEMTSLERVGDYMGERPRIGGALQAGGGLLGLALSPISGPGWPLALAASADMLVTGAETIWDGQPRQTGFQDLTYSLTGDQMYANAMGIYQGLFMGAGGGRIAPAAPFDATKRLMIGIDLPDLPTVGTVLPQSERLGMYYRAIDSAAPASNAAEGFKLISNLMNRIEDAYSGVAAEANPGLAYKGRMYPPREDYVTKNPDGSMVATTKGNHIQISNTGTIEIRKFNPKTQQVGQPLIFKPGKGPGTP